jgi:hypothetical protein
VGLGNDYTSIPLVFFLVGIFCAHWAQNTGRSAFLWFFLGLFFAPLTGLALLVRNHDDLRLNKRPQTLGD